MRLTHDGDHFLLHGLKGSSAPQGFKRDVESWGWKTLNAQAAANFRDFADGDAKNKIHASLIHRSPWVGRIPHPAGLKPLPFQVPAARFILERDKSYLAADPGLGKTIIAALTLNALGSHPVVYFAPPFLALNVQAELLKWVTWHPHIRIYGHHSNGMFGTRCANILIVPDSMIVDPLGARQELWDAVERMTSLGGATAFVDEAHRFKTLTAHRTRALMNEQGLLRYFDRISFLSGTPMPNRPMELYPVLSRFAPETIAFKTQKQYGFRYCAAKQVHIGGGRMRYDFNGVSNLEELRKNVHGKFMLRLRKKDVLKDLPPKTEELIFLAENVPAKIAAVEKGMLSKHGGVDDFLEKREIAAHTSTYLKLVGLAKAPLAVQFIKELLDESDESVIVFAWHIEVMAILEKGLRKFKPTVITGKTKNRQALVDEFQRNPRQRLFLGNRKACGVGFTITKATRAIHVEPSWVPGDNDQATDRIHRIGQKDNVFVQYLVFKNSIDKAVMASELKKRESTNVL